MSYRRVRARQHGFTFIELMIVLLLMSLIALFSVNTMTRMVTRSKTTSAVQQVASMMRVAKFEAVKRNRPVQVKASSDGSVFIFYKADGSENDYNAVTDIDPGNQKPNTLGNFSLPKGILLAGPSDYTPGNADAIEGFVGATTTAGRAIFKADGSASALGAFRFQDQLGNVFEVRVGPTATARVQIQKYFPALTAYFADGEVDPATGTAHPWVWKY